MGLSIAQLPSLLPATPNSTNENSNNTDFKVFSSAKPASATADAFVIAKHSVVAAKADSIDYFLADVMPTGIFSSYDDPPDFVDGVATWVPELPAATTTNAFVPATAPRTQPQLPPLPAAPAAPAPASSSPLLLPPPVRSTRNATPAITATPAPVAGAPVAPIAPAPLPLPAKLSSVGLRSRSRGDKEATAAAAVSAKATSSSPRNNNNNNSSSGNCNAGPSTPAAEALDAAAATFCRVPKVSVPASAAVAVAQAAAAAAMAGAPPPALPPPKLGKRKAVDLASIADIQERRRERRLAKNRATAAVSRERKHAQMQALAVTVYELQREGRKLGEKLAERDAEIRALRAKLEGLGEAGKAASASVPTSVGENDAMETETTKAT